LDVGLEWGVAENLTGWWLSQYTAAKHRLKKQINPIKANLSADKVFGLFS
jgi:hypothetical protein